VRALALRLFLDHTPETWQHLDYKVSILVLCVLYVFGVAKDKHHSIRLGRILGRAEIPTHMAVPG